MGMRPYRRYFMKNVRLTAEKYADLIKAAERYIWEHPETGYKEYKTSEYMKARFTELGYELTAPDDITGFYTVIDTGRAGPTVLVLGELDSVVCKGHPESDPVTGAVHSCGHNAQCAALLGVAAILKEPGMLDGLSGRIKLCAVPAEELIELEYRTELKKQGKIKYFGGKSEYLYRGYFDDVDLAFMVHTTQGATFAVNRGGVGIIAKNVVYKGKSSHAGGSPYNGINALYAASLGLNAVNALREKFKESDIIRFHPIMTEGGTIVNAIPETAKLESYTRGKTVDAIKNANSEINRALIGAALSIGAGIEIIDQPGYAPLTNDPGMIELAREACEDVLGETFVNRDIISGGSTDMGDLSTFMPVIHPYAPGAVGTSHGADYYVNDPDRACVLCAAWQVVMLKLLLSDGAKRAYSIKESFSGTFSSKEEFLAYQDSLERSGDRIVYTDGGAEISL